MHPTSNRIGILGLVSLALALSLPLTAQTTTGRILGSVTDSTGAAVAGASVLVTDTQRGATRTAATNTSGSLLCLSFSPASTR